VCAQYLIAGENDVLDLGGVVFGHASEYRRHFVEPVERQNEDKETTKQREVVRQRRQMIVVQV